MAEIRSSIGPSNTVKELTPGADGLRRMSGGPGLNGSQVYPVGYATAVADEFRQSQVAADQCYVPEDASTDSEPGDDYGADPWNDADVQPVLKFINYAPDWVPPPLRA